MIYCDLLKLDLFLRQRRSKRRFVSFAAITLSFTHPGIYLDLTCLVMEGACLSMRVVRVEWYCEYKASELFLGSTISSDERRSFLMASILILWYFLKVTVSPEIRLWGGDIDLECYGEVIGEGLGDMDV